jgi:hypothetical protein
MLVEKNSPTPEETIEPTESVNDRVSTTEKVLGYENKLKKRQMKQAIKAEENKRQLENGKAYEIQKSIEEELAAKALLVQKEIEARASSTVRSAERARQIALEKAAEAEKLARDAERLLNISKNNKNGG